MSVARIPADVRRRVAEAGRYRCGYCLTAQAIIGPLLEIDHVIPVARGGSDEEDNLVLACPLCNGHKAGKVEALDLDTDTPVPLFNPRQQAWHEHFEWSDDGTVIRGTTAIGRATVIALGMNHPDMLAARALWVSAGWHPPADDMV